MKKMIIFMITAVISALFISAGFAEEKTAVKTGEELFKAHCAVCHPDGGNIVNPQKTLHKKDRDANNIKKSTNIVKKMREPGPGMTKFDKITISDNDAKKIADYILKTFK